MKYGSIIFLFRGALRAVRGRGKLFFTSCKTFRKRFARFLLVIVESLFHRVINSGINLARIAETDFFLIRMDVDVHFVERHDYVENEYRETTVHKSFAVCVLHRSRNSLVKNDAPVNNYRLLRSVILEYVGRSRITRNGYARSIRTIFYFYEIVCDFWHEYGFDGAPHAFACRRIYHIAVGVILNGDFGVGQYELHDVTGYIAFLGSFRR